MYEIKIVDVQGSPMEVFVFKPNVNAAQSGPHPGILLAQHIPIGHTGIEHDTFTLQAAQRFADNGFAVAVPFIFHWWPKEADIQLKRDESRDDWMVADMQAAFDLLTSLDDVDASQVGTVGHCWGGRVAWLAACHNPRIKACATFYGGRVKLRMGPSKQTPIELVNNMQCSVVGFYGNEDENPSPADVDDYSEALTRAGVEHTFHRYDGAGHAFQNFPSPERYRESQSEDAWVKVIEYLNKELKG